MSPPPAPLAPARDPLWFAPLFVLAPARSNSTVVTAMLGRHPQLYGLPELALARGETVAELIEDPAGWRGAPARLRNAGLHRAIAQLLLGGQTPENVVAAERWLAARREWRGADVLDRLLAAVAPRIGVEKSPESSSRDLWLSRLATAYPRARFLHLTRHPQPSVASMHRVWHGQGFWDLPDECFHEFCLGVWRHQHTRIDRFVAALPPDRGMRVRSEDVLNAPERTLAAICRWLGIDDGAEAIEAMRHPEDSPYASLGPEGALLGGDPGFLADARPRPAAMPATLELPAQWGIEPWGLASALELAARLGYGEHRPAPGRPLGSGRRARALRPGPCAVARTGLLDRVSILSASDCEEIAARVRDLRPRWSERRWPGTFTIGRAAYADAAQGANADERYHPRLAADNELLRSHFGDLLELVRVRIADHLQAPVGFWERVALPGFHVFEGVAIPVGAGGTAHFDLQHSYLRWPEALDETRLLSFTLPVALPAAGGGLDVWDLTREDFANAGEREPPLSAAALTASTAPVRTSYENGCAYLQTRMLLHRVAGVPRRGDGDQRITLQGHGIWMQGRWILYW